MTCLDLLQKFQTLAVGLVGFLGVILTLLYNAKLAREARSDVRHHEREVLRVALISELKINRHALVENARSLREQAQTGQGGAFVPTDLMNDAYRSFVQKIGLMSESEVGKVMGAYLSLQTYNAKLFLVGTPIPASPRHVNVPTENLLRLAMMQENMIEPIDIALKALESP